MCTYKSKMQLHPFSPVCLSAKTMEDDGGGNGGGHITMNDENQRSITFMLKQRNGNAKKIM